MSRALLEQLKHFLTKGSEQSNYAGAIVNIVCDIDTVLNSIDGKQTGIGASLVSIDGKQTTIAGTLAQLLIEINRIKTQSLSRGVTNFGGRLEIISIITSLGVFSIAPNPTTRFRYFILSVETSGADQEWRILVDGLEVWSGYFSLLAPVPYIIRLGEFFIHGGMITVQRITPMPGPGGPEGRFVAYYEVLEDDSPQYRTVQADV